MAFQVSDPRDGNRDSASMLTQLFPIRKFILTRDGQRRDDLAWNETGLTVPSLRKKSARTTGAESSGPSRRASGRQYKEVAQEYKPPNDRVQTRQTLYSIPTKDERATD